MCITSESLKEPGCVTFVHQMSSLGFPFEFESIYLSSFPCVLEAECNCVIYMHSKQGSPPILSVKIELIARKLESQVAWVVTLRKYRVGPKCRERKSSRVNEVIAG